MFQAVFSWAQAPVAWITAAMDGVRPPGAARAAGRPAAQSAGRRGDRRSRQRAGIPAADPDPVLFHSAARGQRLSAARRLSARSAHGQHRAVRPLLHPAAVVLLLRHPGHHGDAHHSESQGSARDHPARADDDLFSAAAGLCADHRRVHSEALGRAVQSAGTGAVRALPGRRCRRGARGLDHAPRDPALELSAVAHGVARVPLAQPAQSAHRASGSARRSF